mmetsp:Transcript_47003/g.77783  ORF Transcript_47003/g.77783 Transcript_47003/m.77783 type:complete len:272 (-) Transcript_47003:649-1464(-)
MFIDLNLTLPRNGKAKQLDCLETVHRLGYVAVCWNTEVCGRVNARHARVPSDSASCLPPAASTADSSFTRDVREYSRITVQLEEEANVFALHGASEILRSYDLVAVVPQSEAVLERCLVPPAVELIDVIALPAHQRAAFPLKHAIVRRAMRAGLCFELCYSAALRDNTSRRNFVGHLQALLELAPKPACAASKVAGLVLSSGAEEVRFLRSAYDIMNLLHLFGCDASAAKQALTQNAHFALRRGARRKASRVRAEPLSTGLFDLEIPLVDC